MVSPVCKRGSFAATGVLALFVGACAPAGLASEPAPASTPSPGRWEGVERRKSGLVLLGPRWIRGALSVRDGTVSWMDGGTGLRNVLVPVGAITSQEIACSGPARPCTWTLRTRRSTYVFRDGAPASGRVDAASRALREVRPGTRSETTTGER